MKRSNIVLLAVLLGVLILGVIPLFMLKGGLRKAQEAMVQGNNILKKESREVGDFSGIRVSGEFEVVLSQGSKMVELEAEENLLEHYETATEGTTLIIKQKRDSYVKYNQRPKVFIRVPVIEAIRLSGISNLQSDSLIQAENLELSLSGGSSCTVNLVANYIILDASGVSKARLAGSSKNLNVRISGSGELKAEELQVSEASVDLSGSSHAFLFPTDYLRARVAGSSSVRYRGEPEKVDHQVSGSGSVSKM